MRKNAKERERHYERMNIAARDAPPRARLLRREEYIYIYIYNAYAGGERERERERERKMRERESKSTSRKKGKEERT